MRLTMLVTAGRPPVPATRPSLPPRAILSLPPRRVLSHRPLPRLLSHRPLPRILSRLPPRVPSPLPPRVVLSRLRVLAIPSRLPPHQASR